MKAALLQVSGGQEGAGVKILPRELDNFLGFDPTAIYKLEALQVDNLDKRTYILELFSSSKYYKTCRVLLKVSQTYE